MQDKVRLKNLQRAFALYFFTQSVNRVRLKKADIQHTLLYRVHFVIRNTDSKVVPVFHRTFPSSISFDKTVISFVLFHRCVKIMHSVAACFDICSLQNKHLIESSKNCRRHIFSSYMYACHVSSIISFFQTNKFIQSSFLS